LAFDLGSITPNNQPDPIVWAVGVVRESLVNYATESGFQNRAGYYWSAYQNIDDVVRPVRVRPADIDDNYAIFRFQIFSVTFRVPGKEAKLSMTGFSTQRFKFLPSTLKSCRW
jgi:hypothetical protein